jgi:hypothetical protein
MIAKQARAAAPPARPADGITAEPSEVRFRKWVINLGLFLIPIALLYVHYRLMFPGLTNPDALDFAQVGRNLHEGRGFVTYVLRPLALTHGSDALRQPDLVHGPLYPFLLAMAFGALSAKDNVVALVSGLFYLLMIPVIYQLGTRVFNREVGIAAALAVAFNSLILEYATSGLPITLYIFLFTSLLLVLFNLAAWRRKREQQPTPAAPALPKLQLVLAGILTGALYLTDPIFAWILPLVIVAALWIVPVRRAAAAAHLLLPLGFLVLPWMIRNGVLSGNPVFGLRGMEVWMDTRTYPGNLAYRIEPGGVVPSGLLFQEVLRKLATGFGTVIETLPQITASWLLAFFIPSLLFRFSDSAATTLRNLLVTAFALILLGTLIFGVEMPLFVSLMPAMLVFSIAFLMHLLRQAQVSRSGGMVVAGLAALVVAYPLFKTLALEPRVQPLPEVASAKAFGQVGQRDQVSVSDQPWLVAWHADRPAIWVPASDNQLKVMKERFPETRWLFLTPSTRSFSQEWDSIYSGLQRWNAAYVQAHSKGQAEPKSVQIQGQGHPLLEALSGFATVGLGDHAVPTAVVAGIPPAAPRAAQGSAAPTLHNAGLSRAPIVK